MVMALRDENAEDEKEEKPKVYKSDIASEDSASTSQSTSRPVAAGDDVKPEKNDVGLEADVQPCPSAAPTTAGTSSTDGISKLPSKDASSSSSSTGAGSVGASVSTVVSGASPNAGNGPSNPTTAPSTSAETLRTAFTRTQPHRTNGGFDALVNGLSANANYYMGMAPGLAYLAAAGPSSGGSSTPGHGVIHPMASYPHNLPALYQAAAATAHFMGNRFPGSPNAAASPFSFQQGTTPFAGFSPCYPTTPDGGQTAPSQASTGQATFPFPICNDPKTAGIRSPFGFLTAGQCSPSFGPQLLIQPSALEQWYAAAQRYSSPIFPFMMSAAAASSQVPCSPSGTLSPIVNSSPVAGGAHGINPAALAPPSLIPAYAASPYAASNSLRFAPPVASSSAANALAAMSQISLPVGTAPAKGVVTHMVASANSSSSVLANRGSSAHNGSSSNPAAVTKHRASHERRLDENGASTSANGVQQSSREKGSKKSTHIKKPLNAFMLYMKEMRPTVMQEVGLKERQSAEINRILGRRWHSLTRDEQQKYYDLARHERTLHMQRYPNWSARDNYALHKKKKRKRDKALENLELKKCRARFGLDQQAKWCKHCRRKKKCLWFREGSGGSAGAAQTSGSVDSAEQSPPCAQVTSTTNGPDASSNSTAVLAAETDVNSPQSLVSSTITIAPGDSTTPISTNGARTGEEKVSVSGATSAKTEATGSAARSPPRKKARRSDSAVEENEDAGGSSASEEEGSSDEDEFDDDEEEVDEEAEAAAAARAAAEGADFDDELADLTTSPLTGRKELVPEEDKPSTAAS